MKYAFHRNVRRALAHARTEAIELGHDYVGGEHILLGMLRLQGCRGTQLLSELGVRAEEVRAEAERRLTPGLSEVDPGGLPYTTRARKSLEYAISAARDYEEPMVGTAHLLLGILKVRMGVAAHILLQVGVTLEQVEAHLAGEGQGGPPMASGPTSESESESEPEPEPEPEPDPEREPGSDAAVESRLRIHIDDASSRSIYEQIVGQVKEAVAVGQMVAGERLPTVRRLADQLDIAPGTVARAYRELERLGVVVTEGARGTRVAKSVPPGPSGSADMDRVVGLLRPVVVASFHMGAGADELRQALERAMDNIFAD